MPGIDDWEVGGEGYLEQGGGDNLGVGLRDGGMELRSESEPSSQKLYATVAPSSCVIVASIESRYLDNTKGLMGLMQ